ncbi:MAG TPA: DUF1800 domain-containing protein [Gemmataceae bacterium]|jgi:uncharacterized protein (DUF1800 family)|nr:DUF1800 domain-containing protein [Gemmataceae bacterium]
MAMTLNEIDPAEAWQPWQPSGNDSWNRKWAAHLYRRAAFGASREDLLEAERLGSQGTLDLLLPGRPQAEELEETLVDIGRIAAERDDSGDQLRGWWLYCMLQGGHPLREKLTLFWHNHFATSLTKVQSPALMFRQNCLLRKHALGRFGPLLQAISRDGAMLLWLDSNSNVRGKPNENYARELMELFSLGVGHYTEKDVREAARAFTGWRSDGASFNFDPRFHDDGPKTVLGQTGAWNGGDVVRIVLEQPAVARFLVRKLYHFLVSEAAVPPDSLLEPLCESFRKSDYDIAALVRTMLASRHFYSKHAFRQRIKGPVEYVLGAVQAVYRRYGEEEAHYRPLPPLALANRLSGMGQSLFAPPNVKGWPGGPAWLNTSTLLERDNFAAALAMGTLWAIPSVEASAATGVASLTPAQGLGTQYSVLSTRKSSSSAAPADAPEEPAPPRAFDPARILEEEDGGDRRPAPSAQPAPSADDIVRVLVDLYLPGGIRPELRAKLVAFVGEGKPAGPALARRVREAVHAIVTMAEYHLA